MLDPTDHTNPFSDEPAGASKPRREPEVRLANAHLGAILNDPQTAHRSAIRARADAIKLLAIAVEHQDRGHAVNWRRCLRDYGLSKSHFHRALAVLVRLGILDRVHHGREFATETLASPSRPGYTALPLKLLTAGSALLAFVASVRLSPTAKPLKEVTARLGIRSKNTGKRLLVEVQTFDPGLVASARGAADTIFVARSANFLPPVKFRDVKFRDVKNREAQSIRENIIPADIKNNLPGLDPARSAGYVPSQQAAGSSREGSASPEERKRVPGFNIGVGLVREPQPNDLRSA